MGLDQCALNKEQLAELARGVEDLGYDTLWYPESTTYESLAMGSFLLANSSTLKVASGIANIYARDPFTAMSGHNSLNTLYDDRFCLGLGVSLFRSSQVGAAMRSANRSQPCAPIWKRWRRRKSI